MVEGIFCISALRELFLFFKHSLLSLVPLRVQICGGGPGGSRSVITSSSRSFLHFSLLRDGCSQGRWRCVSSANCTKWFWAYLNLESFGCYKFWRSQLTCSFDLISPFIQQMIQISNLHGNWHDWSWKLLLISKFKWTFRVKSKMQCGLAHICFAVHWNWTKWHCTPEMGRSVYAFNKSLLYKYYYK